MREGALEYDAGYYGETHHPYFSRDVLLYTIKTAKNPRWYIRYRLAGKNKKRTYYQRSLRTTSLDEAIVRALEIWRDIGAKESAGLPVDVPSFKECAELMLEGFSLSNSRKQYIRNSLERYIYEYTEGMSLVDVNTQALENYVPWRMNYWRRHMDLGHTKPPQARITPSGKSIRKELGIIIQVLTYASRRDYLQKVPAVTAYELSKSIETKKTNANNMSKPYARKLRERLKKHANEPGSRPEITWARKLLYYYFLTAPRACLRAGTESQKLQIKHLEKVEHPSINAHYYKIRVTAGKVGERVAILPIEYSAHMDAFLSLHREVYESVDPDQKKQLCSYEDRFLYGYMSGEYKPMDLLQQNLRNWLTKWDMRHDPKFGRITMYSFRSAQINNLLYNKKKNVAIVADIAGTSVGQIIKAYMSGDESDPSWAVTASSDYYDRMFGS